MSTSTGNIDSTASVSSGSRSSAIHAASIVELGELAGTVEQRDAKARLQRLDGLTDRRLDPPELARRRREAAGFRDRFQRPQLIQGHRVEHRSIIPTDMFAQYLASSFDASTL
jgi:hypothetical protein